jgi:lipoprotein-anchoring transpeptidase ErfK/SrfK
MLVNVFSVCETDEIRMIKDSRMNRVSALRVSVATGALFRAAVLTAGMLAVATPADAALYYYRDADPGVFDNSERSQPPRRVQRARRAKKEETKVKETAVHPQMPLVIAVSIASQRVKIYDANGLFAEAPVSTGMPGHPTPQGVFSVIEKDRYHHSNIYSGAPMPFMQRITWGGVALHAGVLPGYPASHGCIRMPNDFAVKMWGWTKMGARVFVTPGEVPAPAAFSHPFLAAYKVAPQPVVAEPPEDPAAKIGPKADLRAPEIKSIETTLDLRPSVGHDQPMNAPTTRTADAGAKTAVTMTDAGGAAPREPTKPIETTDAAGTAPAKSAGTTGEAKPAGAALAPETGAHPTAKAESDDARPERAAGADAKAEEKPEVKVEAKPDDAGSGKKDETRITAPTKAVKESPRRGQIAVFISGKDSRLYVRQNFAPLFDVPITIASGERPLGMHVFTAQVDKGDSNLLHWSVVSVPTTRTVRGEDRRVAAHGKHKAAPPAVEIKQAAVDSPAEALDRITVPPEAMARIAEALTTGGSIIVADQSIKQGETGEYTDFILPLR